MTITTLTTLDTPVRVVDELEHILHIYSRILEERPDSERTRHYRPSPGEPSMVIDIGDIGYYDVTDIIMPEPIYSDTSELVLICAAKLSSSSESGSHLVFSCYTQYSEFAVKMDILRIEDDDEGTLSDFLDYSIDDKQRLLGLV